MLYWQPIVVLCFIATTVLGKCPNSCSGHGTCGIANTCTCYAGWNGGAADCSQRSCPTGTAWADKAYAADFAHQTIECSNAGFCDRAKGVCQCLPGFTGNACQRSACPKDCSGHGVCSPLNDVSIYRGPDYDSTLVSAGDGRGVEYTNWDKDSIQLCECDDGFFGPDCSLVMCPKGDDPLTVNQNDRAISMRVQSLGSFDLEGVLGFQFMGANVPLSVSRTQTDQGCTEALAFKGKFGHVTCDFTRINRLTVQFDITFHSWPTFPNTNNLYSHGGNPSRFDFYCDLSDVTAFTTCEFTDIQATNIKEYAYCSNRGSCNFVTGTCTCHDGFGGPACANATNLYNSGANALPGLEVNVNGLDYVSTALQLISQKSRAPDFYFLQAIANSETVFYVRGDGTVGINKLMTLSGGQTVSGGGLFVESGGTTIVNDGLNVINSDTVDSVVRAASTYTGPLGNSYSALSVSTQSSTPSQLLAIEVAHEGQRRFTVRGDGHVQVRQAGMTITGGVSVGTGGLRVTGGATVHSGGLFVERTGAVVTGGVTIYTDGLKVITGGAQVFAGGASIYSGGMKIAGGTSITSGGFYSTGGVTIGTQGLRLTGGVTVFTRGLVVTGGATINNLGLRITGGTTVYSGGFNMVSGGVTIGAGGLEITTGGLTVMEDGLFLTGGVTIYSDGAQVTGGITVRSGGVRVITGGATVFNGGLVVSNDGLSVQSDGLRVTGGATVYNNGMKIVNGGLEVTQGISIHSSGLSITGGATVLSGNFQTTGIRNVGTAVTVLGGLRIASGLTVTGATQIESAAVVWSDRRLKTNIAPISDALGKVKKLQGVYFNWIQDDSLGMKLDRERHVGVLAQDVQSVLPEVVEKKGIGGKYLGVDYSSMVPLLIEAIHDLDEHLTALHDRLSLDTETAGKDRAELTTTRYGSALNGPASDSSTGPHPAVSAGPHVPTAPHLRKTSDAGATTTTTTTPSSSIRSGGSSSTSTSSNAEPTPNAVGDLRRKHDVKAEDQLINHERKRAAVVDTQTKSGAGAGAGLDMAQVWATVAALQAELSEVRAENTRLRQDVDALKQQLSP